MTDESKRFTIDDLALHMGGEEMAGQTPGQLVMHTWFQLFRTAQIHAIDNQALQRPVAAMVEMTNDLVPKEGRVALQAKDRALFVNGNKLRLSTDEYELAREIFTFFEERGIGGFAIEAPMDSEGVRKLLTALVYTPERRFEKLEAAVKAASIPFRLNKPLGVKKSRGEVQLERKARALIEQHPMRSVEYLLSQRSFSKSTLSQMIVAFEHHRNFDGSGYPYGSRRPDIFSRIVTIADVYDAMTTQRPWRNAFMPDEALGMMSREANRRFDPALMKVFVNTLGLYPVGTLVRLDSGDLGVVIYGGGEGERLNRPIISLLGRDGKPAGNVDLAERSAAGAYRWSIVMTEDPKKFGVQPSGLIAAAAGVEI